MLSILSWKAPSDIPGGRINTMSWRLVCCNFLGANGHDEIRMWPLCFVCPMRRVEYRTIWPQVLLDWCIRRVSSRARFCSTYFESICKICKMNWQLNSYAKYAKYVCNYIYLHIVHILLVIHISYRCTWSGRRMPWTLIPLLSRGIGGKPKEVYDVSWYSYRKRAILSGSTESTACLRISPALPCRIISHLKAW